jgi:EmrB/QacA subfamily drug resistance transporter
MSAIKSPCECKPSRYVAAISATDVQADQNARAKLGTSVGASGAAGAWILAATVLGSSMSFIDSTVVNVAIPTLQSALHASIVDAQWVVESYGLLLSALILVGGALGDRLGRRAVYLTGVVIFAAASAGCGLATEIHWLIFARAIQGVGAALLVPGSLAIIAAAFDEKSRGKAIGTWSGATAITMALGPVLGGWLIQHASWRWAFFLNLPLAAAVIVLCVLRVPESRSAGARKIDWVGALLATAGLGALVTGLLEVGNVGWHNAPVNTSIAGGAICLCVFVFVESRMATPMVPLAIFRSASFSGANLITLFLYAAIGIFFFLFPMDLISVEGYSATAAGAAGLPIIVLMSALSPWAGDLVAKHGGRLPLVAGPIVVAAGFAVLAVRPVTTNYWTSLFPAIMVLGFGMTITVAPLTTVVMSAADKEMAGAASGINNAVARVAGVLAIAVLGLVLLAAFRSHLQNNLPRLDFAPSTNEQIESHSVELTQIQAPPELNAGERDALKLLVNESFRAGLKLVFYCCVALSVISSILAWLLIPSKRATVNG